MAATRSGKCLRGKQPAVNYRRLGAPVELARAGRRFRSISRSFGRDDVLTTSNTVAAQIVSPLSPNQRKLDLDDSL
jgi:hypothetical protein